MKKAIWVLGLFIGAASAAPLPPAVVGRIAIQGEARWDYLAVDSAAHRLYLAHGTRTEVIDTASNTVVGGISGTNGVHGVAIANDLGLGFTSNGRDDTVTVFELRSLKVVQTIKVGGNPDAIVYEPRSRRVVTFNGRSHDATVIDAKRGEVVGTIDIGGKPEFAQVGGNGDIYVNVEDTHELAVVDPASVKLLRRHPLFPCESPTGLAIDGRQRLYSVCENDMMVVSASDGTRLAQVPIGAGADGVVWLDGFAYSANGADGTISVVRAGASGPIESAGTWATAKGARTIAADPLTRRVYLPAAAPEPTDATRAAPARPAWQADSLYILVLALAPGPR